MIVETMSGISIDGSLVRNYFENLVGLYFKILPLYEEGEESLRIYMEELRDELEASSHIIKCVGSDSMFMSLIVILQCLIDRVEDPYFTKLEVKRKVFNAISICHKLADRYGGEG